jgi:UPF0755 protein
MSLGIRRLVALCMAGIIVFAAWLFWFAAAPISLTGASIEFSIPPGSSLRDATRYMVQAGVGVSEASFNLLARLYRKGTQVKAGSYEVIAGVTPWNLLRKITSGDYLLDSIVFVEGWTFKQMRSALDAHPGVRHDTRSMTEKQILERLGVEGIAAEGLFFPDTYLFAKGEPDLTILARAHRHMLKQLQSAWEARAPDLPISSPEQALVLASIIEKEAANEQERRLISGVFANRLRLGMKLQTDPTVIYGMRERFHGNLRKIDLEHDTPFNTYTREGLPPYPIAMPGWTALLAAVQPARTDALYFVARGDGLHQFSRSLDEHGRAVVRYQKRGKGR